MKAFPKNIYDSTKPDGYHDGMDLRDYFAAKAMQGAIAAYDEGKSLNSNLIAKFAYVIADEMMRVRKQ